MIENDYPIKPIYLSHVKIIDNFWAPRIEINANITIPHNFRKCEETGRISNFSRAAGLLKDGKRPIYPFDDSDVFKVIEGAAYSLILKPDSKLEAYLDDLIEKIAAAQEEDGYLYTERSINPDNPHESAGKERWELVSVGSHELYNIGHLIEAGIAYYRSTGKSKLLDVAIKSVSLINRVFGSGKLENFPGHQEIELSLIRLYGITNNKKYLDLAKFFLDIRGTTKVTKYNQSHKRIVEQDEAVGHAVRAAYMYSAITDIVAIYNDPEYKTALNNIWDNVVSKKMYITGGIGSKAKGESFRGNYKLPNFEAYAETCAAIANIFWNHRLFLLYEDAKYLDVLERTLYNGFLGGFSLDGKKFAYSNPLASYEGNVRNPWWECPCCPTNIVRFIPQLPSYIYAQKESTLFVNLFIGSIANFLIEDTEITIKQETKFPWEGRIKLKIYLPKPSEFSLAIRIPGWAQSRPVPSDLYSYLKAKDSKTTVNINNEPYKFQVNKGLVRIHRKWKDNDIMDVDLPMLIRRVISHENIESNIGKVALERGPIVYCLESIDNKPQSILDFTLSDNSELKSEHLSNLLNGVTIITDKLQNFMAIPYYAWGNRGKSQMTVWVTRE